MIHLVEEALIENLWWVLNLDQPQRSCHLVRPLGKSSWLIKVNKDEGTVPYEVQGRGRRCKATVVWPGPPGAVSGRDCLSYHFKLWPIVVCEDKKGRGQTSESNFFSGLSYVIRRVKCYLTGELASGTLADVTFSFSSVNQSKNARWIIKANLGRLNISDRISRIKNVGFDRELVILKFKNW